MARRRKVSANRIMGLLKAALNYAFTEGKADGESETAFEATMDIDDDRGQPIWRKLDGDLKKAERDAGHAVHALTCALAEQDSVLGEVV